MNFLAHAYVSGDDPEILVGNFAGDFIKGRQALSGYPPGIAAGVMLHRAVDEYTDQHPVVRASKHRLRAGYRHYAGVIVDVFYDHFLAARWTEFHPEPLKDFAASVYHTMNQYRSILPARFNHVLRYMTQGNWLLGYQSVQGIRGALTGMASRTTHASGMENAADDLEEHYKAFDDEFTRFFPDLIRFTTEWRTQTDTGN